MSPGLETLEILDAEGARLALSGFGSIYEREWTGSAVAQIRGSADWDIGMITRDGTFHCADLQTGATRWTKEFAVKSAHPYNVVSGDLDGDGRDNFLIGLSNGELIALDEKAGQGVVLWKTAFDAAIKDMILADIDGDAKIEIIVETDDGLVRVLKPSGGGARRAKR
jgi:hypothetical protein